MVYNDSAILKGVLEFPATVVWTETPIFTYILNVQYMVVKTTNDGKMTSGWSVQLSIHHSNTARLYNIGNV